jgi:HSP20 family protein
MNLESWDPDRQLEDFRRRSNSMLDRLLAALGSSPESDEPISFQPEVDLVETSQEYRLYLSIPGIIEDDLVIDIDGRHLTIRGERRPPWDANRREAALQEWRYGFFLRHFELPTTIRVETLRAVYDAGVLTIVVTKINQSAEDGDQP